MVTMHDRLRSALSRMRCMVAHRKTRWVSPTVPSFRMRDVVGVDYETRHYGKGGRLVDVSRVEARGTNGYEAFALARGSRLASSRDDIRGIWNNLNSALHAAEPNERGNNGNDPSV